MLNTESRSQPLTNPFSKRCQEIGGVCKLGCKLGYTFTSKYRTLHSKRSLTPVGVMSHDTLQKIANLPHKIFHRNPSQVATNLQLDEICLLDCKSCCSIRHGLTRGSETYIPTMSKMQQTLVPITGENFSATTEQADDANSSAITKRGKRFYQLVLDVRLVPNIRCLYGSCLEICTRPNDQFSSICSAGADFVPRETLVTPTVVQVAFSPLREAESAVVPNLSLPFKHSTASRTKLSHWTQCQSIPQQHPRPALGEFTFSVQTTRK